MLSVRFDAQCSFAQMLSTNLMPVSNFVYVKIALKQPMLLK
jgi:hypothetical protein